MAPCPNIAATVATRLLLELRPALPAAADAQPSLPSTAPPAVKLALAGQPTLLPLPLPGRTTISEGERPAMLPPLLKTPLPADAPTTLGERGPRSPPPGLPPGEAGGRALLAGERSPGPQCVALLRVLWLSLSLPSLLPLPPPSQARLSQLLEQSPEVTTAGAAWQSASRASDSSRLSGVQRTTCSQHASAGPSVQDTLLKQ